MSHKSFPNLSSETRCVSLTAAQILSRDSLALFLAQNTCSSKAHRRFGNSRPAFRTTSTYAFFFLPGLYHNLVSGKSEQGRGTGTVGGGDEKISVDDGEYKRHIPRGDTLPVYATTTKRRRQRTQSSHRAVSGLIYYSFRNLIYKEVCPERAPTPTNFNVTHRDPPPKQTESITGETNPVRRYVSALFGTSPTPPSTTELEIKKIFF